MTAKNSMKSTSTSLIEELFYQAGKKTSNASIQLTPQLLELAMTKISPCLVFVMVRKLLPLHSEDQYVELNMFRGQRKLRFLEKTISWRKVGLLKFMKATLIILRDFLKNLSLLRGHIPVHLNYFSIQIRKSMAHSSILNGAVM